MSIESDAAALQESLHIRDYGAAVGTVALEVSKTLSSLDWGASFAWHGLLTAWKQRPGRAKQADVRALEAALTLDSRCETALAQPALFSHANTNHLRYELYAGATVVRAVLPIARDQRPRLLTALEGVYSAESIRALQLEEDQQAALADWRRWVHGRRPHESEPSELHGESGILAAACYRMIMAFNPGRTLHINREEVETLVLPVPAEPWRI
jgi:hypothetical protein